MSEIAFSDGLRNLPAIHELRRILTDIKNRFLAQVESVHPFPDDAPDDVTQGLAAQEKKVREVIDMAFATLDAVADGKSELVDRAVQAFTAAEEAVNDLLQQGDFMSSHHGR